MSSVGQFSHPKLKLWISKDTGFDEIDNLLSELTSDEIIQRNCNGYDLLQQAIISQNEAAVSYLLLDKSVFAAHHPACNEYLHLACKVGNHVMVKMILETRPDDLMSRRTVCYPNSCYHPLCADGSSYQPDIHGQLALDVIVATKNTSCLHALLHNVRNSAKKICCPAVFLCTVNHPAALQMLLKSPVDRQHIKAAYRSALHFKRTECLEHLISQADVKVSDLQNVGGVNPYHFLYQYSSAYTSHSERHEHLTATTQVLLSAGVDILAHQPAATYPLYSLIELIMVDVGYYGEEYVSDTISAKQLLSCLKLILKQGVKLDLNEYDIKSKDDQTAYGRNLYRSVFDAISSNAGVFCGINLAASEVIRDCVSILLDYSGDHMLKPSDLTGILKLMGYWGRSKSVQKNLESVVYDYLWNGIDTSLPITQPFGISSAYLSLYSVNEYVEALCQRKDRNCTSLAHTLNDNQVIKWLVNTMEYNALCTASQINVRILSTFESSGDDFTPSLTKFITRAPLFRLKTAAARVIWFSIGRCCDKIQTLPLPIRMKSDFLDIIIKAI